MIGDILQPTHLIFILVVALLVLGPKRLPEVGRSLGRGLRDFKMAVSGEEPERHEEVASPASAANPASAVSPVSGANPASAVSPVSAEVPQPARDPAEHVS